MNEKEYIKKLEDENLLMFSRVHDLEEINTLQVNLINRLEEVLKVSLAFHKHAIEKDPRAYEPFIRDDSTDEDHKKEIILKKHLQEIYESSKGYVYKSAPVDAPNIKACDEIIKKITKEFIP